ncbi:MAG TPA: helix-turn-helix transcriptional regulator [Thermoanaerobaculia bacterium]|nr:helix-turn-helix transcriptional regulator [Thermoanaerobaculia bacterium]
MNETTTFHADPDFEGLLRRKVGEAIVRTRDRRGWTQLELARRLGVSRARLGKWETGTHLPPLNAVVALATTLEVSLDDLVAGERPPARLRLTPLQRDVLHLLRDYMDLLLAADVEALYADLGMGEAP